VHGVASKAQVSKDPKRATCPPPCAGSVPRWKRHAACACRQRERGITGCEGYGVLPGELGDQLVGRAESEAIRHAYQHRQHQYSELVDRPDGEASSENDEGDETQCKAQQRRQLTAQTRLQPITDVRLQDQYRDAGEEVRYVEVQEDVWAVVPAQLA
jgi:hypothetical protein